jgi:two-component system OmpR family response regulator
VANVLIVSGATATSELLRACLVEDGHLVGACRDPAAAPRLFATLAFDVVCLDLDVGQSGVDDLLRWLQADGDHSEVPVLFVLPSNRRWLPAAISPQLRPGLDDSVSTPLDADGFREKVQRLLSRAPSATRPRTLRLPPLVLDRDTHDLSAGGSTVHLTPTEHRLISHLMERPGEVVAGDELLERVWVFHPGTGSASVVRVHVGNLRRKMAQIGAGRLLETLPHRGYRLRGEEAQVSRER